MDKKYLADALAILSIFSIGVGIAFTLLRRAREWEAGILLLIFGIIVLYIRFFSDWSKKKFGDDYDEIKIVEDDI